MWGGSYPGISCANKGLIGIGAITSGNNSRLTVRNGNVGGFGYCVDAQYQAVVSDLAIHDCYIGALAFEGSRVANVSVSNSEIGMYAYGSLVDMVLIRGANFGVRTTSSHISG